MERFLLSVNLSFTVLAQDDIHQIENLMRLTGDGYPPELRVAMEVVIAAGGKRIRPTVSVLVGRMLGANSEKLITMAAAIELLHNATLVHDDLIDGAMLRRGMPTLNSKWSPGATVLTGDLLFSRAAKLAADTESIPAIKMFALTLTRIVGGEIDQLLNNRYSFNRGAYFKRIYAKTGSLFETAACTAAMISPDNEKAVEDMAAYGREIGTAFQIIDDILDFTGDQETLGKPIGSDLRQGLVTLPTLIYFEKHPGDPEIEQINSGKAVTDNGTITRLVESIRKSDAISLAYLEACQFVEKGLDCLSNYRPCAERQALEDLARYIVERKF
jgi:geranylgeranyl pyrophosphate synthase